MEFHSWILAAPSFYLGNNFQLACEWAKEKHAADIPAVIFYFNDRNDLNGFDLDLEDYSNQQTQQEWAKLVKFSRGKQTNRTRTADRSDMVLGLAASFVPRVLKKPDWVPKPSEPLLQLALKSFAAATYFDSKAAVFFFSKREENQRNKSSRAAEG